MRYAIIENGIVANIALADAAFADEMGWVEAPEAAIGMTWDGAAFGPAPTPTPEEIAAEAARVPESVTPYQMQIALFNVGRYQDVDDYVNGPEAPLAAKIAWRTAKEYYRNSPFIDLAKTALDMSDEQIDDLFRLAKTVG